MLLKLHTEWIHWIKRRSILQQGSCARAPEHGSVQRYRRSVWRQRHVRPWALTSARADDKAEGTVTKASWRSFCFTRPLCPLRPYHFAPSTKECGTRCVANDSCSMLKEGKVTVRLVSKACFSARWSAPKPTRNGPGTKPLPTLQKEGTRGTQIKRSFSIVRSDVPGFGLWELE